MYIFILLISFVSYCNCDITDDYFFIYEWPTVPVNIYPPSNATIPHGSSYSHDFNNNNGLGTTIDETIGLYQTWQFSLFRNVFNRLRLHPLRTRYVNIV